MRGSGIPQSCTALYRGTMLLPVLLLLLLPHSGVTPDAGKEPGKGASLLKACQAELRLMQPGALTSADAGDLVNGSYCIGYLNGFLANLTTDRNAACPNDEPMAELVRAYVSYMERNPRLLEEEKRMGLRLALQNAFPCPAVSSSPAPRTPLQRDSL